MCKRHSSDLFINVNVVQNKTEKLNTNGNKTASETPAITTTTAANTADKPKTFEFAGEIYELTSPREPCEVNSCRFCFKVCLSILLFWRMGMLNVMSLEMVLGFCISGMYAGCAWRYDTLIACAAWPCTLHNSGMRVWDA